MVSRRFSHMWKALIAVIAIAATTQSAKADLLLSFKEAGVNGGNGAGNFGTGISVYNGATNVGGAGLTYGDFTIFYTVKDTATNNATSTTRDLAVELTVTNNATSGKKLTFQLSGTGLNVPPPGPGTIESLLTLTSTSSASNSVSTTATYVGDMQDESDAVNANAGSRSTTGTQSSGQKAITVFNTYSVTQLGSDVSVASGAVKFTSEAKIVGVPEPAGIAAAFAGLPCMGMLIGFVRRRRVQANAATAA